MRCPPRLHKLGCKRIGENGFNLAGMGNIFHHRRSVHNENIKKYDSGLVVVVRVLGVGILMVVRFRKENMEFVGYKV